MCLIKIFNYKSAKVPLGKQSGRAVKDHIEKSSLAVVPSDQDPPYEDPIRVLPLCTNYSQNMSELENMVESKTPLI